MKEQKFRLDFRKSDMVRHWKSLLEEVVQGQIGWGLEHLDLGHFIPAHTRVEKTRWSLRSHPTKGFPWLYYLDTQIYPVLKKYLNTHKITNYHIFFQFNLIMKNEKWQESMKINQQQQTSHTLPPHPPLPHQKNPNPKLFHFKFD